MSERPVEKAVDWVEVTRPRLVGFAPHIGITIDTLEPGHGTGHCDLTPEHFNPYGFAHGGAINALMDTVGGFTASVAHGELRYVVTRSADVHYLRPVLGGTMYAKAEAVKAGKQTCLVRAEVFDEENRLCAEGLLEFFYLDRTVE